jgi:hypothetical protein
MHQFARMLIAAGLLIAAAGLLILALQKFPFFGRLPGDIHIVRKHYTFYFPIVSSLLISVVVSFVLWLIARR